MLKYIVVFAIFGTGTVFADVKILRNLMGSGIQNELMTADVATPVGDHGVYHAPQYMPGFPTAATIWPRIIEVQCQNNLCAGYEITPALGRGEYLFFKPVNTVAVASIPIAAPAPMMKPPREIHKKIKE